MVLVPSLISRSGFFQAAVAVVFVEVVLYMFNQRCELQLSLQLETYLENGWNLGFKKTGHTFAFKKCFKSFLDLFKS